MPSYEMRIAWSHGVTLRHRIFLLLFGRFILGSWKAVWKGWHHTTSGVKSEHYHDWIEEDEQVILDAQSMATGVARTLSHFEGRPAKAEVVAVLKDGIPLSLAPKN